MKTITGQLTAAKRCGLALPSQCLETRRSLFQFKRQHKNIMRGCVAFSASSPTCSSPLNKSSCSERGSSCRLLPTSRFSHTSAPHKSKGCSSTRTLEHPGTRALGGSPPKSINSVPRPGSQADRSHFIYIPSQPLPPPRQSENETRERIKPG